MIIIYFVVYDSIVLLSVYLKDGSLRVICNSRPFDDDDDDDDDKAAALPRWQRNNTQFFYVNKTHALLIPF